jgi:ERCC4-type nuclease
MARTDSGSVVTPFVILRDTREQAPWTFQGLVSDATDGSLPLIVRVEWESLGNGMGDYTLAGMEHEETGWRVSIERKSLDDLFGTVLGGRKRFKEELANLNQMEYAAVVVEADWPLILTYAPQRWIDRGMTVTEQQNCRKSVVRSILAWQMPGRFPNVRWWLMPSRRAAEVWAFRILERFWKCQNGS